MRYMKNLITRKITRTAKLSLFDVGYLKYLISSHDMGLTPSIPSHPVGWYGMVWHGIFCGFSHTIPRRTDFLVSLRRFINKTLIRRRFKASEFGIYI